MRGEDPLEKSSRSGSGVPETTGDSWGSLRRDMGSQVTRTFLPVVIPLAAMWLIYVITLFTGNWVTITFGLNARSLSGLWGILFMPLLHGSLGHLLGNTMSWLVLGGMVSLLTRRFILITALIWIGTGVLLWLLGTPWICQGPEGVECVRRHIGASGVVYGFGGFLIAYGIIARRFLAVVFSLFVMLGYGITMLFGMLPITSGSGVSWTAHLFGALTGVLVAFWFTRKIRSERRLRRARRDIGRLSPGD